MITYQRFMVNAKLKKSTFLPCDENDHEHCTMCGVKFSKAQNDMHEGYVTLDGQHWVCPECLNDYAKEYSWTLEN